MVKLSDCEEATDVIVTERSHDFFMEHCAICNSTAKQPFFYLMPHFDVVELGLVTVRQCYSVLKGFD